MLDLIIRNGKLIDGTGQPARLADLGIKDGRIVAIGKVDEEAARVIDARGQTVAPGFIDVHTHLDAQVCWDPLLHPVTLQGVTTVVGGNCGLSLGPVPDEASERDWLIGLFGSVEAIPLAALREGVSLKWRTFGEYLDEIDRPLGSNAAFFVGHGSLRRAVMGPDASVREATADEIEQMKKVLSTALAAGGLGFSTATQVSHLDGDGQRTPPQFAAPEEFIALASVLRDHEGTCMQITPGSAVIGFSDEDREMVAEMAGVSGRPVFWLAPIVNKQKPTMHERMLETCDMAAARGGKAYAISLPGQNPLRQTFANPFFMRIFAGTWGTIMTLPLDERLAALKDPEVRAGLRSSLEDNPDHFSHPFKDRWAANEVVDVENPEMEQYVGRTIGEIGAERGTDPFETILDLACEGELNVGFVSYDAGGAPDPWTDKVKEALQRDPRVVWGGSDSGAHVDALVGADFPGRTIQDLVRGSQTYTLEEAVHYMSAEPARTWGLTDRGTLEEGKYADIVIFDAETFGPGKMERLTDWPGGAWRLSTSPYGVKSVIVNGIEVVSEGGYTGELGGQVLRSGRDTMTTA